MSGTLDTLLRQPGIWRAGDRRGETGFSHVPSGFAALDAALPGGGWLLGALAEIIHAGVGIGELSLVVPAMAQMGRSGRWVALAAPPHLPYAPALAARGVDLSRLLLLCPGNDADAMWAIEQALRSGVCGVVAAWPGRMDDRCLRRLQLAAETGGALGVLFRRQDGIKASPAAVRLRLERCAGKTVARLLKCRGGMAGQTLTLNDAQADSASVSFDAIDMGGMGRSHPTRAQSRSRPDARTLAAGRLESPSAAAMQQTMLALDAGSESSSS